MSNKSLIAEIQRLVGSTPDGIIGPRTLLAICDKLNIDYTNDQTQCMKNIQKHIGTDADGLFGPNTYSKLVVALGAKPGYTGADQYKVVKGDHVIIDIGHANGTGARNKEKGLEEHAINVVIGAKFKKLLEDYGCKVTVLDFPELENDPELAKTVKAANAISGAKVLVSLHSDCSDAKSAKGGHVCYRSDEAKQWATKVSKPLAELLPGRAEHIMYRPNLAILKVKSCPAILCEGGFISNDHDSEIQSKHPELIAEAYFKGLTA